MSVNDPGIKLYYITLVRHAQSVGNASGYWQGQSEFPLTETGRAQARALAQRWQSEKRKFDICISSPLGRARETADIIAHTLKLDIEEDGDWMERDNGVLAGLKIDEAQERHPQPDFTHPYQPVGINGESQWELYLRAGRAVQKILCRKPGSYLIISHGGILNMALYAMLSIPVQANFSGPRFRFRNTAFATLTYNAQQHRWYVQCINDHTHWTQPDDF